MSQKARILNYLKVGQKLTRLNAWNNLGILEAPARISELRAQGHQIKTKMVSVDNQYGETIKIAEWYL